MPLEEGDSGKYPCRDTRKASGICFQRGEDVDINRWVTGPPQPDGRQEDMPRFGSAHSGGCHFVFCDGAVRLMSYQIDAELHRRLGNRHDGLPVDQSEF
ncbi:MAG: DUF1559 family PulG-like putative transporter [Thermoguttaceae bacterium]